MFRSRDQKEPRRRKKTPAILAVRIYIHLHLHAPGAWRVYAPKNERAITIKQWVRQGDGYPPTTQFGGRWIWRSTFCRTPTASELLFRIAFSHRDGFVITRAPCDVINRPSLLSYVIIRAAGISRDGIVCTSCVESRAWEWRRKTADCLLLPSIFTHPWEHRI